MMCIPFRAVAIWDRNACFELPQDEGLRADEWQKGSIGQGKRTYAIWMDSSTYCGGVVVVYGGTRTNGQSVTDRARTRGRQVYIIMTIRYYMLHLKRNAGNQHYKVTSWRVINT